MWELEAIVDRCLTRRERMLRDRRATFIASILTAVVFTFITAAALGAFK